MVICGGGAKSMFWRQMIADVYGVNVKNAECGEGPAYGAAALGAVACGAFSTVESVCENG